MPLASSCGPLYVCTACDTNPPGEQSCLADYLETPVRPDVKISVDAVKRMKNNLRKNDQVGPMAFIARSVFCCFFVDMRELHRSIAVSVCEACRLKQYICRCQGAHDLQVSMEWTIDADLSSYWT